MTILTPPATPKSVITNSSILKDKERTSARLKLSIFSTIKKIRSKFNEYLNDNLNTHLVEATGICLRAEFPRADKKGEEITIVFGRSSREPTVIRVFSQPSQKTKKYGATVRFHRIFGRGDGDRTHDLSVPNAARYQLRYASIFGLPTNYNKWFLKCQSFLCYE